VRRAGIIVAATVLTAAAVLGLLAFFNSRDDSTIGSEQNAPGRADPRFSDDRLRRGTVILYYGRPGDRAGLEAVAREIAGAPEPALVEAGQAVLVERGESAGIVAAAYRRTLSVRSPDDPQLREFVQFWLGRSSLP
jgi:hypothetical protein